VKVAILGAGSFGTALATTIAENSETVYLWGHSQSSIDLIKEKRVNDKYLPGIELVDNIYPTTDLQEAISNADVVYSAIPTQAIREVWKRVVSETRWDHVRKIIVASKGIEQKTLKLGHQVLLETIGEGEKNRIYLLSGPSFALEMAQKKPTVITISGFDKAGVEEVQNLMHTSSLRVYGTTDLIGAELAGAMKNVIAIATGISDGLGMGSNSRAALITRGLAEIARLGAVFGSDPITFMGLSGLGDLVLTCTGDLSRNRRVGLQIGQGIPVDQVLAGMKSVAEGVYTCECAYDLSLKHNIVMPISEGVYKIIYQKTDPKDAIAFLMKRDLKFEKEG